MSVARTRLEASAIEAFAARGFHATTTRDICLGAGMSPAALYSHFESKESLLFELARRGHESILQLLQTATRSASHPTEALRALVYEFVLDHAQHHTLVRIVNYELHALTAEHFDEIVELRAAINQEVRQVIREGIEAEEFQITDADVAGNAVLSMGIDLARWYHEGLRWSPEQLAEQYATFALGLVRATAL